MQVFVKEKVNYAGIDWESSVNGEGLRVVLYFQGCGHHCEHCHNKQTWNPNLGDLLTYKELQQITKTINEDKLLQGITLSGGDPFLNSKALLEVTTFLRENLLPEKTIWCYTGYTIDQLKGSKEQQIIKQLDVLVDGKFEKHLNDETCRFKGSANQKIYYFKNGVVSKIG